LALRYGERQGISEHRHASLNIEEGALPCRSPPLQDRVLVRRAIQAPLRQIAGNAGVDGSVVVGKVIENDSPSFGFDAQAEEYGDMLKAGVIDPTKVVRIALENAASIAGLLITTEAMVAQKPGKTVASSELSDMCGMM
jgi:chaperonin GroEL